MRWLKIGLGLAGCAASSLWYLLSPTTATWWLAGIPAALGIFLLGWAGIFDFDESGGTGEGPWDAPPGDGGAA